MSLTSAGNARVWRALRTLRLPAGARSPEPAFRRPSTRPSRLKTTIRATVAQRDGARCRRIPATYTGRGCLPSGPSRRCHAIRGRSTPTSGPVAIEAPGSGRGLIAIAVVRVFREQVDDQASRSLDLRLPRAAGRPRSLLRESPVPSTTAGWFGVHVRSTGADSGAPSNTAALRRTG